MLINIEITVIFIFFIIILYQGCHYIKLIHEKTKRDKIREISSFWRQMGIKCIELGKYNEGLNFLEKAKSIDEGDPDTRRLLGTLYYEMKLYDDARWELYNALRLNPNDQEALSLYNKIGEHLEFRQSIKDFYNSKPKRG